MKSIKPRKQRKELFNAPIHKKRKWIASHLAENLLLKYDRRSAPVIEGDTVKVMRGIFKGHEDKVVRTNTRKQLVEVEGVTIVKADGTKIAKPMHPSNLLITKLNLTDRWRRRKLEKGLSEETKKEIEKEAEEQIKTLEEEKTEEKVKAEEGKEKEAKEEKKAEEKDKIPEKKEERPKKKEEKKAEEKVKAEEKDKIPEEKKQGTKKKSVEKKGKTPQKKSVKKPSTKTKKKEEKNE